MQQRLSSRIQGGRLAAAVLAFGVAVGLAAGGAEAQTPPPAKWDQARVTDIAIKLSDATKALYVAALKAPDRPIGAARKAQYTAREDVREMNNIARRLAAQLKDGKGRDETEGAYQRLQLKRRDAEEAGRRLDLSQEALEKIAPVQDLLRQLAPYYEDTAGAQ